VPKKNIPKVTETLEDEEYLTAVQSALAYCVIKNWDGALTISQEEWESVLGNWVGANLEIFFDEEKRMIVTLSKDNATA
jgi:hypothetical protein